MTQTKAKTMKQALEWIVDHEHHEGWWGFGHGTERCLTLAGNEHSLVIPESVHEPGLFEPCWPLGGRMYRPSAAGLEVMAS
ncbi:hypothetical protein E2A64_10425 [Pseudohoeflea suaedae]|uniref:Uncharacterized protein n=1 Tax=Pseudohoeflea suaedae TaxID=877384 RepID=A0A4R5PJA6_9HYPH|nr:hypothetical protein [Pseudohoeflea suaedae]TDH35741.1 hypothetical protein E2A64_10425 [Pseudohoeflea suaedae]